MVKVFVVYLFALLFFINCDGGNHTKDKETLVPIEKGRCFYIGHSVYHINEGAIVDEWTKADDSFTTLNAYFQGWFDNNNIEKGCDWAQKDDIDDGYANIQRIGDVITIATIGYGGRLLDPILSDISKNSYNDSTWPETAPEMLGECNTFAFNQKLVLDFETKTFKRSRSHWVLTPEKRDSCGGF